MPSDDAVPTKPQIERQLVKMLENEIFVSRPQLGRLLAFLVARTLADQDVTEQAVREGLFPTRPEGATSKEPRRMNARSEKANVTEKAIYKVLPTPNVYVEDSAIVRRTAGLLRKALIEYYTEDPGDSLVVIHLPQPPGKGIRFQAGEAYKPRFTYNAHHQISQTYLMGCHYLQSAYLNRIPDAVRLFDEVLKQEPEHAGAMLQIADAFCYMIGFHILQEDRETWINAADGFSRRALAYAAGFWHTHATRALVHYCRGEFDEGEREFHEAVKLNREKTETNSLYSLFLAANGRPADALQLTEFLAEEHFDDAAVLAQRAMHLCGARRFDEAEGLLERAFDLDRNCWFLNIAAIRINLALDRPAKAQEHAERLKMFLDPDEYEYWMAVINALHKPN